MSEPEPNAASPNLPPVEDVTELEAKVVSPESPGEVVTPESESPGEVVTPESVAATASSEKPEPKVVNTSTPNDVVDKKDDVANEKADEAKEKAPPPPKVSMRELFRYSKTSDFVVLFFGLVAAMGAGATQPLLMVLFGDLTGATSAQLEDISSLVNPIAIKMLYVMCGAIVLYFTAYFGIPYVAAQQIKRIREEYFRAIVRQDMAFFDMAKPGSTQLNFNETCHDVHKGLSQKLVELVDASTQLLVGVSLALYYEWRLAAACVLGMPFLGLFAALMVKAGGDDGVFGKEAYAEAAGIANEALSAMRTLVSFSGEVEMAKRYQSKLGVAEAAAITGSTKSGSAAGAMMATFTALYAVGFGVGGIIIRNDRMNTITDYPAPEGLVTNDGTNEYYSHYLMVDAICRDEDGELLSDDGPYSALEICACDLPWHSLEDPFTQEPMTYPPCGCGFGREGGDGFIGSSAGCEDLASILTAFFCFIFGGFAMGQIGPALEAIDGARIAAHKIFGVIDRIPDINLSAEGKRITERPRGEITFENVHFNYKQAGTEVDAKTLFNGLSLTIKPGETVALVGESGSGKSTIGRLVGRMYDPSLGRITLDGVDLKDLNVSDLRNQIGLVSQEPLLFDKSIRENIELGRAHLDQHNITDIETAAKAANAHNFIMTQLPEMYETTVGSRGSKLSGGQKQRVAIARALYKDPSILILDEATSALDTESERIVQQALDELLVKKEGADQKTRTTIIIAHRLTTVKKADRILVLGEDHVPEGSDRKKLEGAVVREEGTHEQLMAAKGLYYALVGSQAKEDDKENLGEAKAAGDESVADATTVAPAGADPLSDPAKAAVDSNKEAKKDNEEKDEKNDKADKEKKEPNIDSSRVWAFLHGGYEYVAAGLICAVANGAIQPAIALVFSEMLVAYTSYDLDQMSTLILRWCIFFIGLAAAQMLFHFGQIYFMTVVGERITTRIRGATFRALLRQDITYFDNPDNNVGALTSQLGADAARVQLTAGASLGAMVNSMTSVIFGFTIAFFESWLIAIVILAGVPVIGLANVMWMQIVQNGESGTQELMTEAAGLVNEAVVSMREVQAFSLQPYLAEEMSTLLNKPLKIQQDLAIKAGASFGFVQGAFFGFYALSFWWGGKVITDQDNVTFENFTKCLFALAFSAMGAGTAATFAGDTAKAEAAKQRIFKLLDRIPPVDSKPWLDIDDDTPRQVDEKRIVPSDEFKGAIEINKVNFTYPTRKEATVFKDTSISIPAGATVALVGTSGSGKSTAIQLLERFYDPLSEAAIEAAVESKSDQEASLSEIVVKDKALTKYEGKTPDNTITIDGYDLASLDLQWVRQNVGLVGQEPVLFHGSIEENIAWGKPGSSHEEVVAAAKAANAYDFIIKTGGFDRDVGERGSKLSGGQKQRIAIARAIIKNPKILLLDEATSALDNESEQIVQASLDALLSQKDSQRTTIVVAHRLSTIRNADKIYVLNNDGQGAKVVESGTHDELIALKGVYFKLAAVM